MTGALLAVGVCHILTAWSLRPAATRGRLVLAGGGVATVLVALLPLPGDGGGLDRARPGRDRVVDDARGMAGVREAAGTVPRVLRPAVCIGVTALLLGALGWFFLEVLTDGGRLGLSERIAAGMQALWPLAVVVGTRLRSDR
jgi:hypothetical protein